VKICNQLVKKMKNMVIRQEPRWSDLIRATGQIYPGKEPNQHFGPVSVI